MQINSDTIPPNLSRPAILSPGEITFFASPGDKFADLLKLITNGKKLCFTGTYGFAISFYSWLKKYISEKNPVNNYQQARVYRETWQRYSQQLYVLVKHHRIDLQKSGQNPWLRLFYPDKDHFYISIPDLLGLNGAWQWYEKGIQYPMLTHRIHPFYGTYFPTRYEHLILFDNWLKKESKPSRALDMGTGCGVLSFIMYTHGIRQIHATDINPNAIFSVNNQLKSLGNDYMKVVVAECRAFFGSFRAQNNDLVVFNPPWIPGKAETLLDTACYFEEGFFDELFHQIEESCEPGARIALLFSDHAVVSGETPTHPLSEALARNQHAASLLTHTQMKVRQTASRKKTWLDEIRSREHVELFVLRKK